MRNNVELLIALFILFTAFLATQSYTYIGRAVTSCSDSDQGDLFTAGITSVFGEKLTDYCEDNTILVEYYCSGNELKVKVYSCPETCSKGACLQQQAGLTTTPTKTISLGSVSNEMEINEFIGDVQETVTEDDTDALQGGIITTAAGATEYEQTIRFEATGVLDGKVVFAEDDNNNIGDFLAFFEDNVTFEYALDFNQGLESEITSSHLEDIEDENIKLLDRIYRITDAKVSGTKVTLRLVSGDFPTVIKEGETKDYQIKESIFKIQVLAIDDTTKEATLLINSKERVKLKEGEIAIVEGILLGASDILISEAGEGEDSIIFYLGAESIEWEDNDYTDDNFRQSIKVNGKTISNGYIKIRGTGSSSELEISSIKYQMKPEGNQGNRVFIAPQKGLREYLKDPESMLANWDIRYNGLTSADATTMLKFDPTSSSEYDLEFSNNKGDSYDFPFLANVNGNLRLGSSNNVLHFAESGSSATFMIARQDYLVLTNKNDKNGVTSIVRYSSIDTGSKTLHIDELAEGGKSLTYQGTEGTDAQGDLIVNGYTYRVFIGGAPDYQLAVDLNSDGDVASDEVNIILNGGGKLDIGTNSTPNESFNITLTTEKSQFDNPVADEVISIEMLKSGSDVDLNIPAQAGLTIETASGKNLGLSTYGVSFKQEKENPDELTIQYPESQALANIELAFFATPSSTQEIKKTIPAQEKPATPSLQTVPAPIATPQEQEPSPQKPVITVIQRDPWYLRWLKRLVAVLGG